MLTDRDKEYSKDFTIELYKYVKVNIREYAGPEKERAVYMTSLIIVLLRAGLNDLNKGGDEE